jgi:hypothetical protein
MLNTADNEEAQELSEDDESAVDACSIQQISVAMDQVLEGDKSREGTPVTSPRKASYSSTAFESINNQSAKTYRRQGLAINTEICDDFASGTRVPQTESYTTVRFDFSGLCQDKDNNLPNSYLQRYSLDENDYFTYTQDPIVDQ